MASPTHPDNGEGSATQPRQSTPLSTSALRSSSPAADASSRQISIARLASPVPSPASSYPHATRQLPVPIQPATGTDEDIRKVDNLSSLPGPGQSMIASALQESLGRSPPRLGTPPRHTASPALQQPQPIRSNYGSFDNKPGWEGSEYSAGPYEDPEVVKRHLVLPQHTVEGRDDAASGDVANDEEFSSLQLQGGDITRQVYRWAEGAEAGSPSRFNRSKSFSINRPTPQDETMNINSIRIPGGFRRDYIRRTVASNLPGSSDGPGPQPTLPQPQLPTSSFLEFLTLFGHFAGEELEEDDEVLGPDEYFSDAWEDDGREPGERSALLRPETPGRRKRKPRGGTGTNTRTGAALLLLKSFVGTGVLFLPRAFLNGGMLFSSLVLLGVSLLSFYAFILLVNTRLKIDGSFGDIGGILYGKHMRRIILGSIVLSQLGFVSAYIVFTAENLQAFVLAVSNCKSFIDIKFMVLIQLVIFLPLSLIRDISKLGFTALIADVFILLGLIYLYYYDILTISAQGGVSDIVSFNPSTWTLFIGTAIFTYEGIGLIIPIQESMKRPQQFPGVLAGVMVIITIVFLSAGALSYAAYGSTTKTVILLNLPQDDKFVNGVQFLYSLAILLSTPLQLFPAIRIMENELFTRSGKYNPRIKWQKNCFRFFLVMICAFVGWGGADDLDKFVSLVGSFACVPLIYVYPPLLHLKACAHSRKQQIADIALTIFGVISCIYTTSLTLANWVGGGAPQSPGYCDSKSG
ncbi:transmembrane amino acid transporter protein-domain-containing protein [Aspergillus bertholletiae]|uniref:Transmembrane amino acid transporter protein-domain-containing protein n=1 Tax=Aspergillus bertholletiae TaxID=1226010 RepID=A0A5N7BMI8_9EURO|nr:transmembrane amino acid transporter protein-domain-containing protein [Aspergillus bertholletiae]